MSSPKKSNEKSVLPAFSLTADGFAQCVLAWQQQHGRHDLPWQQPATPYRVLVSEIMLQQTQVSTVVPYFQRWMETFPDLPTLAAAEEDQVMALWQGLGYYSRARNLQKAARYLVNEYDGQFPQELTELEKIPGVGRYTAGAIRAFAFDAYGPIVDGNVRRLFCRLFTISGQPLSTAVNKTLWQLAEHLTPNQNNRNFAQGLLDLGATVCKPKSPNCEKCPFVRHCQAKLQNRVAEFPNPKTKKTLPTRHGHFLWQLERDGLWLERRPEQGIWATLWALPELESAPENANLVGEFLHTFSHYKLRAQVWQVQALELNETLSQPRDLKAIDQEQLEQVGMPTPIRKFIQQQLQE
ncbi:MAG: A/G-specific adenine glycosylase [Aliidiomarina sp.]|uniref:A/G-specific adenine glycosylase n=1 Tax=Aliidiomarina sp. TaxID=1872439 RepID=UPI0025BFB7DD|nr:A/G-specific adenine glycosylase [Aliidiomarina sp.]MCH8502149.1 A/G-specific adenine glycosylase [Aliidiomarina sp.]